MDLDEFYRNALSQGLELEQSSGRGLIPNLNSSFVSTKQGFT